MTKNESLSSLFGKAKRWAQQELKNASTVTGEPRDQRNAEERNERLAQQVEDDSERMRNEAIISALTPQSVKDYHAYSAANKAEREVNDAAEARAARHSRSGASRVELSGCFSGVAEGLAVETTAAEEGNDLYVNVECVDAVPMNGCTLRGFCFLIPGFHGDGSYPLFDHDQFDATQYELYVEDEFDGWAFHPSYGPGVIVVTGGIADVDLVLGSSGSETAHLHATVVL